MIDTLTGDCFVEVSVFPRRDIYFLRVCPLRADPDCLQQRGFRCSLLVLCANRPLSAGGNEIVQTIFFTDDE